MRTKTSFIFLAGMLFCGLQPATAQNDPDLLVPSSKVQKEQLLHILSFIETADAKGLGTSTIGAEISDTFPGSDIVNQIKEKKEYLESEVYNYNCAAEQARIQNLIFTTSSIAVLDTIIISRKLMDEKDYCDLTQQIFWKKQIIERENLESAYESFNLFGTSLYLPINKTINENLPEEYFTRKETIEKQLSDFSEKMYLKTNLVREIQQFLGEILYAATPEQINEIQIPDGIRDKKIRTDLSMIVSEAANSLKILNLGEVEKARNEIVYRLSELPDTNEMDQLMNFRVRNKYLKEVIDEIVQMRIKQVLTGNNEEWIGTQIDKIYNAMVFIREERGGWGDSVITIDPEIRNAGIRSQLSAEVEMILKLNRKLRQCNAEWEIYRELAYADDARAVSNLPVDSTIMDVSSRIEIRKAVEQVTRLLNDYEQYQQIAQELTRIDQLIREAYTPQSLQHLQVDSMIRDDSIKQILEDRIEQKILLLQNKQYFEKQTSRRSSVFDFFTSLRKIFTLQALDEIKIPVFTDDPECTQWMVNSLETKRRYFESQLERDKKITALRESLN
ncbi:MAG: hypothetical protein WCK09_03355 [Bacteroidota bacterium]